ncbi:hypothetical protein UFOVP1454_50 [uncultured Caudovirales phage]|uniref:Uncharacterized protein n=1 Tax=uncultured Caudovirales phage TaxID=2100421 RepID=A0A6J5SJU2_9CAUD|nr:hypothetical protein UFOVP1454_50 [uncultured Caudovirales phage]
MATLSALRTLIANKLSNGNLIDPTSAQIDAQINSTIEYYESDAFWFSETIASLTTTASTAALNISSITDFREEIIPNGLTIVNGTVHYPLQKITPLEYESRFIDGALGLPTCYTYRKGQFEFWYTPDQAYTVKLFYRKTYANLSADADYNDFTVYAARLIEYKTLADLLRDYRSDNERAMLYDVRVDAEYNKIKKQTNNRTVTGNLTTENIVDSNYTPFYY